MAYNACNSFTWIGPQVVDGYKNECFGRNDSVWSPSTEANHTSGHKDALNARYTASKIQKGNCVSRHNKNCYLFLIRHYICYN